MTNGLTGSVGFALAAAAWLQFGFWGAVFIGLAGLVGWAIATYLWPNRTALLAWLKAGGKQVSRGR